MSSSSEDWPRKRKALYTWCSLPHTVRFIETEWTERGHFGSPAAGRPHADLSRIIGMFVNTLAIRTRPEGDKPFSAFLEEVKETTLGAFEHQDYPFEELIEKLNIQRDMSRNPLFDAVFQCKCRFERLVNGRSHT
ncbi:condensation domain-containing protein [Bacillus licheniformis]|nr:condensation domain-containing protein [Bacillus licheniformis]